MPRTVRDVVFSDGVRTPFGKAGGVYANTRADDLVIRCIRELLRRNPQLPPERVDEVAIAATTQIGDQGLTIGRTAALLAGLPKTVPGYAIDRMCAGAMTAVTTVASGIAVGAYDVAIAGGVEHMGRHPMGEGVDPNPRILAERLVDPSALVMGATAENLHDRLPSVGRDRADRFALASQQRTATAYAEGKLQRDLVTVAVRDPETGWGLSTVDEAPRPDTSLDKLGGLRTPFRPHGKVTAGNAAGLNDGATACLVAAEDVATELGLPAAMRLVSYGFAGVEPEVMGVGPIPSTERALRMAGLSIEDIGLFELNEAFAVQVLAFLDHFGIDSDDPRVNPWGGAIAVGHPLASSGVRLMTQLARQFAERPDVRYGLTAMCVGIGMGGSVIWENTASTRSELAEPRSCERRRHGEHEERRRPGMDEVVTRALLRLVDVPGLPGQAALITLDNGLDHTKPNTLGAAGLASLDEAVDRALAARPALVAVTGKPYVFCVGADVTAMPRIRTRDDALAIGRLGHRIFARLRSSDVPMFAFVNGAAMGGGLELALHCHYRTLSAGAGAIALPEVSLGLVPAWGGTQLLPNLIGIVPAAQVIVQNPLQQNRMLRPAEAYELGIADAYLEPADFLERSLEWAAAVVRGEVTVERAEVDRSEMWDAVIGYARQQLDERLHGAAPAPYRALDLLALAQTASFVDGTRAEDEALADLALSDELRNGLYAFDLVQRRAKRPVGAPPAGLAREVTKVGIVGAGLMASQLALLFIRRLEVPVVLTDLDQERVDKGLSYVSTELDRLVGKGRLDAGKAAKFRGLVSGAVVKAAFADADLVLEAVFEDLAVKKQVWAEVEKIVRPDCVLATNTSSLSVTGMAADLDHPERVVGLHFFNPVAVMPLLEVVHAQRTDDATLATAFAVGKQLRKSCVLVADRPAFVVNRLLTRFLGEVQKAIDAGTPDEVADAALDPLGLPMRPSALRALVGPEVAAHVAGIMHAAYPDRFRLGSDPDQGGSPLTADQVRERALDALAEEIGIMLDEGVVADRQDIDLCMILGAGWPFHLGGITPYLARHR